MPIEEGIRNKIDKFGKKLADWDLNLYRGITTGLNEAFIIDEETKNRIISKDPKSSEIIKPILRGRDIARYRSDFAGMYVITTFPSKNIDIEEYPAVKAYLESFDIRILSQSGEKNIDGIEGKNARKKTNNKWFETQDQIGYWDDFLKQKVIWKRIGSILRFSYDETGFYGLDSTCIATGPHTKYLCMVLNSSMGRYLLKDSPKTGTGDLIVSIQALEPIKIPVPNLEIEYKLNSIYDEIVKLMQIGKSANDEIAEAERLIFSLYSIDETEINYIKSIRLQ